MADNLRQTGGANSATDDVAGVHYQRFKLDVGADGAADPVVGSVPVAGPARSVATNTAATVGVASAQALAANAARVELVLVNDSINKIYLRLGTGTAVLNAGVCLNPNGGSYSTSVFTGAVQAIATAASSVMTVLEI